MIGVSFSTRSAPAGCAGGRTRTGSGRGHCAGGVQRGWSASAAVCAASRDRARRRAASRAMYAGRVEQRQPRCLHRVEVAVGPRLVLRLPLPPVDVRRPSASARTWAKLASCAQPMVCITRPQAMPEAAIAASPGRARTGSANRRTRITGRERLAGDTPLLSGAAAQRHGPGNRRPHLHDLEAALQEGDERPAGPVVEMPRGVAERAHVLQPRDVERPPQRFPAGR